MEKDGRVYKSAKNVIIGISLTIINSLIGFVNRTVFIKYLGPEYLGLNGLFTEVLSVLSLAELGVGMAINYSLYKPIHERDNNRISQLMALFRKAYNIISLAILIVGLIILPFIHLIVNETNYSIPYIRLVFFLFVVNTSVSYLFSYNTSFVGAIQKQYIVSIIQATSRVIFSVFSILILITTQNYILYLLIFILTTIGANVWITLYVRRNYSFIDFKAVLPREDRNKVFCDIKNIFIKRVSGVITTSTDNILISALVSTIQVGLYSNYQMIFYLVRIVKSHLSNGIKASIGDLSVSESPEQCRLTLNRLTILYYFYAMITCSVILSCCRDVITLWIGAEYVMDEIVILVAVFTLYLDIWEEPLWQFLEVSGLFMRDRNIAILGSLINLSISLLLGLKYGIVGIFLGTILSQYVQLILKVKLLFKNKFKLSSRSFLLVVGKCTFSFFFMFFVYSICNNLIVINNLWAAIIIKGLISFLLSSLFSILFFIRDGELAYIITIFRNILKRRPVTN